jgi:hypothetical protein
MFSRSNAVFAGIFALAIVATVLLFTIHPGGESDASPTGKLSPDVIEVESQYKAIKKEWLENEAAFREAKLEISSRLTNIHQRMGNLVKKAAGLAPMSAAERDAVPHLVGAVKATERMIEPYVIRLMAPARIGPAQWEQKNKDAEEANAEWAQWLQKSKGLAR